MASFQNGVEEVHFEDYGAESLAVGFGPMRAAIM
jgi:hypothetical protein